jgi:hypothetical protein
MQILVDNKFGTGYVPEKDELSRSTNHIYKASNDPFDWVIGYNVENVLQEKLDNRKFKLPINNQLTTSSCGGQAFSKFASVLKPIYDKTSVRYIEFSARDIYANNHLPGGGMYAWDGALYIKNTGIVPEAILPSYPMTEDVMRNAGLNGDSFDQFRELIKGGSIQLINNRSIEAVARAMRDNYVVVLAVLGKNNGTWHSDFPVPPRDRQDAEWGHLIMGGKALSENNNNYIWIPNSWGEGVGRKGWQGLGKNYFESGMVTFACTWNPSVENLSRGSDFQAIREYLVVNDITSYKRMDEIWSSIQVRFKTDITLGNYYDYRQMVTKY